MKDKPKYFNFPITLLNGIFEDKVRVLDDIIYFALYAHSLKMDADELYNNTELSKFKSASEYYGVTLGGNEQSIKSKLKQGKQLSDSIPKKSPRVGVNIQIWWDFYKNDKSEFDIASLCAFLALKSILGEKPYCKTNNLYLWSRMTGNGKSIKDISELPEVVQKYANEYQTVKLKTALRNGWGLITYSRYTRGFYVSFKLNLPALVMEAEKRRKSTKEKQYRQREKDVVRLVLQTLNNTL
jgi:hypothetical protein